MQILWHSKTFPKKQETNKSDRRKANLPQVLESTDTWTVAGAHQTTLSSAVSIQQLTSPYHIIEYKLSLLFAVHCLGWWPRWLLAVIYYLSCVNQTPEGGLAFQRDNWNDTIQSFWRRMREREKGNRRQYMGVYTWKHRQPSSVIGDPNRITRQARILPSIFKCYIGQVENFYLLICGVNTCGLEEEEKKRRKRGKVKAEESKREIRTERKRKKWDPTAPKEKSEELDSIHRCSSI